METQTITREAGMSAMKNHVPELLAKRQMTVKQFVIECMQAGMSPDTAYRFVRRETKFRSETIQRVAEILGAKSIDEVISLNGQ